MRFPMDMLSGTYTRPRLFLCETDKSKICQLEVTNLNGSFKFNSTSEITFDVSRVYTDLVSGETRVNQYYNKVESFRVIEVEGFGYFELQGIELISDGIAEKKSCTAYSLEYTLAQKYLEDFYVNMGTVESIEVINATSEKDIVPITLYNTANTKLSLLHIVLSEIYGWTIGHVDPSLWTLSRQFEIDRESIYDFLINDVCEKFNCYIVFDTINNTINVYAESLTAKFIGDGKTNVFTISPPFAQIGTVSVDGYKTTRWEYNVTTGAVILEDTPDSGAHIEVVDGALTEWETDVFVSFDNLAQEVNINYDADAIKTKLTVTYGDDYDIREANLGMPYLTDISYYYTVDWMGQDLYDAYTRYMQKSNNSQSEYTENSQEILKWNDYISYEENRLSLEYSLVESVNSSTVGTYYTRHENLDGSYYYSEVSLPSEYIVGVDYYSNATTNVNEEKVGNLYTILKSYFYAYFNKKTEDVTNALNDLKDLLGFEFMETYTLTYLHDSLQNAETTAEMDAAISNFLGEIWAELGRTPLREMFLKPYNVVKDENINAGWSNKKDENYGNYYPVNLVISSIESAIAQRDQIIKEYQSERSKPENENKVISDGLLMKNNFTEEQLIRLSPFLREDELHIEDIVETELDDLSSSFKIKQDAMESGRIELQKICQPQLQFAMTMANIYALPEFAPIISQFQLGKVIKVCLRPDYIKQSRLLQVNINFDNFSEFSCEFGELTTLRTQSDIHADLLSNAITAGKSVATNSGYWTRGSDQATALDLKIQQGLLDATTQIKAIDGTQGVVIDKYGIKLQKQMSNGEIDPHQTWLVNNMILMSDDGFRTSRSALGQITVGGKEIYGLLADAVIAGYIEGSKIVGGEVSSVNYISNVSGTHLDLANGDFDFAGGKIVYNSQENKVTLKDVTIQWDSVNMPSIDDFDEISEMKDDIEAIEQGLQTTTIDGEHVISPKIIGGYLNITNTSNNSKVIIDPNNLTGNNYVFQVHNGTEISLGIDKDGNASFSGEISAESGDIGGWEISSNDLIHRDSNKNPMVIISSSGSQPKSYTVGSHTGKDWTIWANGNFGVTNDGKMYADNADISGKITAKSGTIAGFYIGSDAENAYYTNALSKRVTVTDSTTNEKTGYEVGMKATNGSGDLAFYVVKISDLTNDTDWKNASKRNNVFYVKNNGSILSTSGTIGGWNIGNSKPYGENAISKLVTIGDYDYEVGMRSFGSGQTPATGHAAIYVQSNPKNTAWSESTRDMKFYISYGGHLYAKDAEITGTISSSAITGSTINNGNGTFAVDANGKVTASDITVTGGSIKIGTNFTVDTNGNVTANALKATNADISGKLTAGEYSKIGDFNVDNNSVFAGSWDSGNKKAPDVFMCIGSNKEYTIADKTTSGWAFGAGSSFGVTNTGALYCKSGKIGGWTISDSGFMRNVGNYNDLTLRILLNDVGVCHQNVNASGVVSDGTKATWSQIINSATNAATTYTNESDINVKNSISTLDLAYDNLFDNLIPCKYKYNHGTSDRYHTGFIAQEVVGAVENAGLTTQDFAGVIHLEEPNENGCEWLLRRDEFVALNTWQIQKLKQRVAELEEKLKSIERN